jgi:hypothetical protein
MTKKSKFLTMFEKLSDEEQEKVAQVAYLIGDLIAKKGLKKKI